MLFGPADFGGLVIQGQKSISESLLQDVIEGGAGAFWNVDVDEYGVGVHGSTS